MSPVSFRARWIFPVCAAPLRDAQIVVDKGRIIAVGPAPGGGAAASDEKAVIIPALVNCHTHLEFSRLDQPIGSPRTAFPEWIREVVAWRRSQESRADPKVPGESLHAGIEESVRSGVGTIGEIARSPLSREILVQSRMSGVAFLELIGLTQSRHDPLIAQAREFLVGFRDDRRILSGISPHAPYTVRPELIANISRLSGETRFPIAMHLAESEPELALLRDRSGDFVTLLQDLGAWDAAAIPVGTRPLDYLQMLAQAHRALVIHGNYLDNEEIRFVGQQRDTMSVVYCPRTHQYFGHAPYPIVQMLDAGARMALGTDSRASNPNLSLWEELRFAVHAHPGVAPETWLRIATWNGAAALGREHVTGSLEPGKSADFLVIDVPGDELADPWTWIASEEARLRQVYLGGQLRWELA